MSKKRLITEHGTPRSAEPPNTASETKTTNTKTNEPLLSQQDLTEFDLAAERRILSVGIAGLDTEEFVDEDQVIDFLERHAYTIRRDPHGFEAWPPVNSPRLSVVRMPRVPDPTNRRKRRVPARAIRMIKKALEDQGLL